MVYILAAGAIVMAWRIMALERKAAEMQQLLKVHDVHVNRWLEDIPEFYRTFPGQLKAEILEEMQTYFQLILHDLQTVKKTTKSAFASRMQAKELIAAGKLRAAAELLAGQLDGDDLTEVTMHRYALANSERMHKSGRMLEGNYLNERARVAAALHELATIKR